MRRQQVAYAVTRGLSSRRACALLSVARSTLGYVSRLIARDAPVAAAMRTLAGQYPRYGYRTIRIFLDAPGARDERRPRRIASGARRACRCRGGGRAAAWPPVARGRCRRPRSITCGRTTSCSTPAPMGGR